MDKSNIHLSIYTCAVDLELVHMDSSNLDRAPTYPVEFGLESGTRLLN